MSAWRLVDLSGHQMRSLMQNNWVMPITRRDIPQNVSACNTLFPLRIKLCLLLWLGFFKIMKLLLSARRDFAVR